MATISRKTTHDTEGGDIPVGDTTEGTEGIPTRERASSRSSAIREVGGGITQLSGSTLTSDTAEEKGGIPLGVAPASRNGVSKSKDNVRNEKARASALMDLRCLEFLEVFMRERELGVETLGDQMETPKDWMKIVLLARADFVEPLDGVLRITSEGDEAWTTFTSLAKAPKGD